MVDHLASGFTIVGLSVPEFFWGLLLILLFGSYLRLLPTSGYVTLQQGAPSYVAHLVLPVITLAIGLLAHVARLTRSRHWFALWRRATGRRAAADPTLKSGRRG